MPTIYDVARVAGVSITTVSRVLNGHQSVRSETKRKVEEAMRTLKFVPNASARSLTLKSSRIVALIVPDISNPFYSELARGAQDVCDQHDYSLLIASTDGDPDRERLVLERLCQKQVDGLCMVRFLLDDSNLRIPLEHRLPVVLIGAPAPNMPELDNVGTFGTGQTVRQIVEMLVQDGRHRLAHVAGPGHTIVGSGRRAQYDAAVKHFQLDDDPELIATADFSRRGGEMAGEQLFSLSHLPDMVFCANDVMASGLLMAAERTGLRVPDDLAIFGCDDIDLATLLRPSLTTIQLPKYALGQQGIELLLQRIAQPDMPVQQRSLQVSPVFRHSTATQGATTAATAAST